MFVCMFVSYVPTSTITSKVNKMTTPNHENKLNKNFTKHRDRQNLTLAIDTADSLKADSSALLCQILALLCGSIECQKVVVFVIFLFARQCGVNSKDRVVGRSFWRN